MSPKQEATEPSADPQISGGPRQHDASPIGALRWVAVGIGIGSIGLIAWSFANGGKEAIGLIPLGVMGLIAGFLMGRVNRNTTDYAAVSGAVLGLLAGGFVGATCGLGRVAIEIINPNLPAGDFETLFGGVIGGIAGALLGVLAAAVAVRGAQTLARKNADQER